MPTDPEAAAASAGAGAATAAYPHAALSPPRQAVWRANAYAASGGVEFGTLEVGSPDRTRGAGAAVM